MNRELEHLGWDTSWGGRRQFPAIKCISLFATKSNLSSYVNTLQKSLGPVALAEAQPVVGEWGWAFLFGWIWGFFFFKLG